MNRVKFKLLFGGVFYKKLRLFLSILGIIIGVASLFTMNTFGESAKVRTLEQIETFGPNLLMVVSGQARVRAGRAIQAEQTTTLKLEDAQAVKQISGIVNISPFYTGSAIVRRDGKNVSTVINGVNEEYLKIRKFEILEGRNFLKEEIAGFKKVAILGHKVKTELFGIDERAEGEIILINKLPFIVIGVLRPIGVDASNQDQDDQILVPITTAMSALFNVDYLTGIYIAVSSPELLASVEKQIDSILLKRHKVSPKDRDFNIIKAEDIFKFRQEASQLFTTLVQSVSILCLIVGSIGVTAVMLLSVNERKKEIGLRLALGADRTQILVQFLLESVFISLLGGFIGLVVGIVASLIFLPLLNYPLVIAWKPILVSSTLTVLFGLVSGIYPAYRASKIDPAILLKGF